MCIGHDKNFLSIEKIGQNGCPIWRFEATVIGTRWMFAAMNARVLVNTSAETCKHLAELTAGRKQRFEFELL